MASPAMLRLQSDLRDLQRSPPDGCSASPEDGDLFYWQCSVVGPEGTPWEGGIFNLPLHFPESYPQRPPRVKFVSQVWHPNVYADGSLCLDILQTMWSPAHSVASVLTSIQSLLCDPNCASPANADAAREFLSDRPAYERRVRRLAQRTLE